MAYRAGAKLKNMRFMQFHPTSLYASTKEPVSFLISEALRGFGAYIVDGNNNRFLYTYDSRGELATRDIISSAIYKHMLANDMPFVYLDLRHLDLTLCKKEFPQIFAELKNAKLNPQCDLIPITPSAHYQCGGVVVDKNGQSSIRNLYALGEVACTGLHGANRLASNSLLEALVFAHNAAHKISRTKYSSLIKPDAAPTKTVKSYVYKRVKEHTAQLKNRMMNMAFEENPKALEFANAVTVSLITSIEKEIKLDAFSEELLTLRNLAQTANLIMADKLASYDIVKQI
jgi:L-aspartate oxidase